MIDLRSDSEKGKKTEIRMAREKRLGFGLARKKVRGKEKVMVIEMEKGKR